MSNKFWVLDFVITDVQEYEVKQGAYYMITFKDIYKNLTKIQFLPESKELTTFCFEAIGYKAKFDDIELVGRVIKGTLFENENRLGELDYNIAYFKEADNSYQADLFFQKFNNNWTDERKAAYEKRLDYVQYLEETFDYKIHQSLIDQAINNSNM